jgi:hypothetical protein
VSNFLERIRRFQEQINRYGAAMSGTALLYDGRWYTCEHDPIDNGFKVSECRKCRKRMVFKDMAWSVEQAEEDNYTEHMFFLDG